MPELWQGPAEAPGFTPADLQAFVARHRLAALADVLPERGDAAALARIAGWGAALADLTAAAFPATRQARLEAAAAFNLAVALFDSAIDTTPARRAALCSALAPARLQARLCAPDDERARLSADESGAAGVATLFDAALVGAARIHRADPVRRAAMGRALAAMYAGAVMRSGDPFVAKTGPVTFIGLIALPAIAPAHDVALYAALARLCQRWDDALDLAEDLCHGAPNGFLGNPCATRPVGVVLYALRAAARIAAGGALHEGIARALAEPLASALRTARVEPALHARTLGLCRDLLG